MRGTKITVHEYFDGRKELFWKKRKLTYSIMDKPLRQVSVADSKAVNTRVDKAMILRNTGHKPAPDHPWRNLPIGKSASDGKWASTPLFLGGNLITIQTRFMLDFASRFV